MDDLDKLREVIDPELCKLVVEKLPQGESKDFYKGILHAMYAVAAVGTSTELDTVVFAQTVGAYILVLEDNLKES